MNLKELENEVREIKARAAADTAFIRCAIFTLGTEQLLGAKITLDKLAEDMTINLLYMPSASDEENHAFEDRKKFWLDALQAEIAYRSSAGKA